jgi:predicted RNA-binding Zn-ribbon protein involved in translation (DUF1610 family)
MIDDFRNYIPSYDYKGAVYSCDECGKAIYAGDDVYKVSSEYYCTGCMDGFKEVAERKEM